MTFPLPISVKLRTLLYVPASSERFLAKAHECGADAIILDLEDTVAPARKDAAREYLPAAVTMVGRSGALVFVRINAVPDRLLGDAEAACRAGAAGLFVPKARDPAALAALGDFLGEIEQVIGRPTMSMVPMIEDAGAVLDARTLALASPRVVALITDAEDLAAALGAEPTPDVLRMPKLMVHYAAKAAGMRSFGLMRAILDYTDLAGVEAAAREARGFGFDGASCMQQEMVAMLNRGFSPTPQEIVSARALLEAADRARAMGLGAFAFEGRTVDEPTVRRARTLLERGR